MLALKWMLPLGLLGLGLVLKFGGPLAWALNWTPSFCDPLCLGPCVIGNALYIAGCFGVARAKNRTLWWGFSGLLCVLALPTLYFLRDRSSPSCGASTEAFALGNTCS